MKCKPYSEITVEIGTQLKTVKITSNIFAVYVKNLYEQKAIDQIKSSLCKEQNFIIAIIQLCYIMCTK